MPGDLDAGHALANGANHEWYRKNEDLRPTREGQHIWGTGSSSVLQLPSNGDSPAAHPPSRALGTHSWQSVDEAKFFEGDEDNCFAEDVPYEFATWSSRNGFLSFAAFNVAVAAAYILFVATNMANPPFGSDFNVFSFPIPGTGCLLSCNTCPEALLYTHSPLSTHIAWGTMNHGHYACAAS